MPTPPFSHAAYRFWLPTAMAFFVNGAAFGGWAALVPRAIARLQADEGAFGLMLLGMGIGSVLAMAFSGRLIAKFGAGLLIRLSLAIFLAAYIVLSIASDWTVFVTALLLFGAAGGMMDVAMNAYAADVEAHMDWRVMASFHGMWSFGGLAGAAAVSAMLAVVSDLNQALSSGRGPGRAVPAVPAQSGPSAAPDRRETGRAAGDRPPHPHSRCAGRVEFRSRRGGARLELAVPGQRHPDEHRPGGLGLRRLLGHDGGVPADGRLDARRASANATSS